MATLTLKRPKNSHSSPLSPWYVAGCLGSHVPVASKGIQHVGLSGPGQTVPMGFHGTSVGRETKNVEIPGPGE